MSIPVSLIRCGSYDPEAVWSAVRASLEPMGGMGAFVKQGQRVLLKPNLLIGKPPEAAVTTHPEIVRAVAMEVQEAGGKVFLGDSPALGSITSILSKTGIDKVVEDLEIGVVPFRNPVTVPVPGGTVFKSIEISDEPRKFDVLINLPKLKTHTLMLLTLAVKNLFGSVVGVSKAGWHFRAKNDSRFADLLLDISRVVKPDLNILDGILAMEGNGPGSGDPRWTHLIVASPSAMALDQVTASVLGVGPDMFMMLARAREQGIEGSLPEHITTFGLSIKEAAVRSFRLPVTAKKADFSLPPFIKGRIRQSLSAYPVLNAERCITCGACADTCPVNAIVLHDGGGGDVDRSVCISCFCCQEICPERAIDPVEGRLLKMMKTLGVA